MRLRPFGHDRVDMTIAVKKSVLEAPLNPALMRIGRRAGLLLSLLAVGLALAYGRTIAAPIRALVAAAATLGRGERPQPVRAASRRCSAWPTRRRRRRTHRRRGQEREAC